MRDAQRVRDDKPHVSVNARAGVKTRIGKTRMIHAHGDDIVIGIRISDMASNRIQNRIKPNGRAADELAVDPDFGIVINAVEFNRHKFVFLRRDRAGNVCDTSRCRRARNRCRCQIPR